MELVGYLRVSSTNPNDTAASQRAEIKAWAKANGHKVVAWFEDSGVSGTTDLAERPGLTAALEALRPPPEANGLVVARLDRLARQLHIQESVLQTVWLAGGHVYSADAGEVLQDDPDDPMRTFVRQIVGCVAQLDRALTVKKLRNGKAKKVQAGGYAHGGPPYGWRAEGGELVKVEAEQKALKLMRSLRTAGSSYRTICQELEQQGFTTKRGGSRWLPATVRTILERDATA